jgi:hypothetical protein
MTILEANDLYLKTCRDKYAQVHWLNYRQDLLGESVRLNWLLQRMSNDTKPLTNLNGSINTGVNQPNDTRQFIETWVNLVK